MRNNLKEYFNHHQKLMDEESEESMISNVREISIKPVEYKQQQENNIENTLVHFPYQPYDVQIELMKQVIVALNNKQNALLESPTGTGKTLSLLCGSLAWLKKHRSDQIQKIKAQKQSEPAIMLKIIYASRTHVQLKQVARELKKTIYSPNVSMLGSRDQYCIRGDFSQIKGTLLNQSCRKAVKGQQCQFYKKDHLIVMGSKFSTQVMNLEESRNFGYSNKCCPYYFERQRLENADLILLPYNYLLEKDFQEIVNIENCILIFDEAHNVQSTAEEGSSFFITHNFIQEAEKDLERWIDELESVNIFYDELKKKLNVLKLPTTLKEYRGIMITIRVFAQFLETIKISPYFQEQNDTQEKYEIHNAKEIFDIIFTNTADTDGIFKVQSSYLKGINKENITNYIMHCMTLLDVMSEQSINPGYHFEAWIKFIININDLIIAEDQRNREGQKLESLNNPINQFKLSFVIDQSNQLTLYMWCLDPAQAFNRLLKKSIYSVILTSGTLAPFNSWSCELKMPFQIQLSNKHIIDINKNLRVFQHKTLEFSYQQRQNDEQICNLGITLLNLCSQIPHGVLVIFSSYSLMNKFRSKFTYAKILTRLSQIKQCFWEPQKSSEMHNVFEGFKQKALKGAIMFAVQRGKVAEGIDFSDELCRAIFLIGVPYPPTQDNRLKQKMEYLDHVFNDNEFNAQQRLKSKDWYSQQAIRATNQAIGRVIRHIDDYGIVYLCDKRFEYTDMKKGLSEWIKPAIQSWISDDDVLKQTKEFFSRTIPKIEDHHIVNQPQIQVQKKKPQFFGLTCRNEFEKLKAETQKRIEDQQKQFIKQPQIEQTTKQIQDNNVQNINQINITQPENLKVNMNIENNNKNIINNQFTQKQCKQEQELKQDNEQSNSTFDFFSAQAHIYQKTENQQQLGSKKKLIIKLKSQQK